MLLSLHTTTVGCHVALVSADRVETATAPQASTALPGLAAEVLARAGVALPAVEALVVALGPGSFTGIKIGLATAWGLSRPHGLAVRGIGSLDALASAGLAAAADISTGVVGSVVAVAGGYGGLVYGARFRVGAGPASLGLEGSYRVGKPDDLLGELGQADLVVLEATPLGEVAGPELLARKARVQRVAPSAELAVAAARLAAERAARGESLAVEPLYLRADPAKAW